MDNPDYRKRFEASILQAVIEPKNIIFVRRENECVKISGEKLFNTALLPHPDVTLEEFFSSV